MGVEVHRSAAAATGGGVGVTEKTTAAAVAVGVVDTEGIAAVIAKMTGVGVAEAAVVEASVGGEAAGAGAAVGEDSVEAGETGEGTAKAPTEVADIKTHPVPHVNDGEQGRGVGL